MHYVTGRSHRSQKHKFDVMCASALCMETTQGRPEQEKFCINISHPGRNGIYYVTHRSHRMQKHKFGIMCLDAVCIETTPG
jgi:hypothetical protein